MRISAQEHIIKAIEEALETSIYGQGLAAKCKVTVSSTSIEILPEGKLNQEDVFWLGYFVREYVG